MHELDNLYKIKGSTKRRLVKLLVSEERLNAKTNLDYEHWKYTVPFAFREALDLRYIQRSKNKKKYMVWTQGPCLRFQEGDVLHSKCGSFAVQVTYALPMGWDEENNEMYEGSVLFDVFHISHGQYFKQYNRQVTQLEFLKILIDGIASVCTMPSMQATTKETHQLSLSLDS